MNYESNDVDIRYDVENIEQRTGTARKRLNQEITRNWRKLSDIRTSTPKINLRSHISNEDGPARMSIGKSIVMDWETNSPISPVSPDYSTSDEQIVNTMGLISLVREYVGRDMSEITDAKSARELFRGIRRTSGVHMKDIFDEAWNGYSHITEAYPYASMKFSIGLEDGLDKSGRLTTFADGDMTVFADSNNMFWYQNGLLLYASNLEEDRDNLIDVFVFSDEGKIHNTEFHKFNESFYMALRKNGKDHSNNPIMQHLRALYSDIDGSIVKDKLSEQIQYTSVGVDNYTDRLSTNKLICEKVDEFSKRRREELLTDESLEAFIEMGVKEINRERANLMNRGKVPLGSN